MKKLLRIFVMLVLCFTNPYDCMANAAGEGIGKPLPRFNSVSNLFATPDAPTNLVVTPLNTGGMIQFNAPLNDGGSAITNYEYSIDNGATWVTPSPAITSSPIIISSGLTNCTSYQVKIRAVNTEGSGAASLAATLLPSPSTEFGANWMARTSAADNSWRSVTYGNGLFVAVANSGTGNRVMTSPDGVTWTARTSAADNQWQSVTFGNGLFVAVASSGTNNRVMTSPDGITWTARTSAADNEWRGVTYGNGLFVAVAITGTNNRVMTSTDGINWTARTSAANNGWLSVTYGNGQFVAVAYTGTGNRVMTSPDGITWTARTSVPNNEWWGVTFGNSIFVAVGITGTGNRVMTSPDGITWTSSSSVPDNNWVSVTYFNNLFIAVATSGTGNRVMASSNGTSWTAMTSAADNGWVSVTYANGLFVAVAESGTGNRVMTRGYEVVADAPLISAINARNNGAEVIFSNTASVYAPAIGNYEYSTDDGSSWIARSPASSQSPLTITGLTNATLYNIKLRAINSVGTSCASTAVSVTPSVGTVPGAPTNLVVTPLNTGGMIQFTAPASDGGSAITNYEYSTDNGDTWITPSPAITTSPLIISSGLTNCTSYQVKIRAVNASGSGTASSAATLVPRTSTVFGITWIQRTSAADNEWRSVTYGNGLFVAVAATGTGNRVMTSPDGTTWTIRTSAADNNWLSVTYGNGLFVAVASTGTGNRVMTSPDGIAWTSRTSAADNTWNSVTYGNGLFVAVSSTGTGNRVMTSQDGIIWTARTSAADNNWLSVTYGNGLFVAVASTSTGNRVMTSPDGVTWTARTSAADNEWRSVTYGNGLFVAVASTGTNNRVMTSPDGINWTIRTSATDNNWLSVTYGNGLFVAVAQSGTGNRVMSGGYGIVADAPVISAINARNNEAQVIFSNTASVFAPAISNYEYSTDDGSTWIVRSPASSQSPLTITGLSNGTLYNIKIRAINSVGTSCTSNMMSTTPALGTVPAAPTNLVVTPINTGGMIQFTAPANDGGSLITNYEYSTDNGSTWITPSPAITTSPLIISSGLTNCTSYQVMIRAVNASGNGAASVVATLVPSTSTDFGSSWSQRASAADNSWFSVTYGNGLFVAVATTGTGNRVMTSPDGITWTARTSAADNQWTSITYGNSLFVAVANNGTGNRVMTSPDGITWTSRTSAADNQWNSVTYGNGLFVAVASTGTNNNRVMTSPDGITWTTRTSARDNGWNSVTYGNGLFVAVANNGGANRVMTSPDGITWTASTSAIEGNGWNSVTYGNGLFVAVAITGAGNRVMTSINGINWTSRSGATGTTNWNSVTYGNGLFVAVTNSGTGNRVMTSPNGITWTAKTSAADNSWRSVTYGNGLFVAVSLTGVGNRVMTSSFSPVVDAPVITAAVGRNNGAAISFTQTASGFSPAVSNYEYSTDNGTSWTARFPASYLSPLIITGLTNSTTYALQIRAINSIGTSCPSLSASVTPALGSVPDAPTNLVVTPINSGGMIQFTTPTNDRGSSITNYEYSIDGGSNWITPSPAITTSPLIISSGLTNCTSYQLQLRAVNISGSGAASLAATLVPSTSTDFGSSWSQRFSAANNGWLSVTYGNGLFVAVSNNGTGNRVMTSPDGITWTSRPSAADLGWTSVTYGNGLFVAVAVTGSGNRVMTSPDGITWTSRTSAADNDWLSVTYGNGLFVAVSITGTGNRVMTSPDGTSWTSRTSAMDNNWYSVTYGNGLFVAVATSSIGNRVMTSPDGITWTTRTSAANNSWNSVTYGEGLFVAVAQSGTGNRVMTSPDGIIWTIRTSASDNTWQSVTYGNGKFVAVANGTGNRVMTSPDGITWTFRISAADNAWRGIVYGNGLFVAVSDNGTGNRVMTSSYNVVADVPVISSVTVSQTGATVSFTQSIGALAPAITNYRYSIDNGSNWTTLSPVSTSSPITVTGLTDFTNQIQLQAINSVGNSCPAIYLLGTNLNKYGQKTSIGSEFVNKNGALGISGIRATGENRIYSPVLSATTAVTDITATTASSGGTVDADRGAAVTARGVCWSLTANPTTANSKTIDGNGTGTFTSAITGLTSGTTYYVRSYAINSIGTTYGPEVSFTTL
jgi:hypothetical protein